MCRSSRITSTVTDRGIAYSRSRRSPSHPGESLAVTACTQPLAHSSGAIIRCIAAAAAAFAARRQGWPGPVGPSPTRSTASGSCVTGGSRRLASAAEVRGCVGGGRVGTGVPSRGPDGRLGAVTTSSSTQASYWLFASPATAARAEPARISGLEIPAPNNTIIWKGRIHRHGRPGAGGQPRPPRHGAAECRSHQDHCHGIVRCRDLVARAGTGQQNADHIRIVVLFGEATRMIMISRPEIRAAAVARPANNNYGLEA